MGIRGTRFKGRAKVRGRPREFAHAEIMVSREQQRLNERKSRRFFFTLLDLTIVASLGLALYQFYKGNVYSGFLSLIVGFVILMYYVVRRVLKKN